MKFSTVVLSGLAAAAQVKAEAQPVAQPDVGEFFDGLGDDIKNIWSGAGSGIDSVINQIKTAASANNEEAKTIVQNAVASVTAEAGSQYSSLSAVAATATGEAKAKATSEMGEVSSRVEEFKSRASKAIDELEGEAHNTDNKDKDNAAAYSSVAIAMLGAVGGAAIFFNL